MKIRARASNKQCSKTSIKELENNANEKLSQQVFKMSLSSLNVATERDLNKICSGLVYIYD